MTRRNFSLAASAIFMFILILDSKNAIKATWDGVQLCLQTLIPSLFPFLILSSVLTSCLSGMSGRIFVPIERLMRIPSGFGSLFLIGLLGGYPVGARSVRQAYDAGQVDKTNACRMLSFCNNAGPSFLFGIIAPFFSDRKFPWILWLIHILSAILTGVTTPGNTISNIKVCPGTPMPLSQALNQSIRTMATVCGWVILFRLVISFPQRWFLWLLSDTIRILLTGFTELSNGCILLGDILSVPHRMLSASAMLSFGGLCVTMQTKSLWGDLPFGSYLKGKLIQTLWSLLICGDYLYLSGNLKNTFFGTILVFAQLPAIVFLVFRHTRQKNIVAIPA